MSEITLAETSLPSEQEDSQISINGGLHFLFHDNLIWHELTRERKKVAMRIAVIEYDRCKPNKCSYECIRFCPLVRSGLEAIGISDDGPMDGRNKPVIYEDVCNGCGICVKSCPFGVITIVNTPEKLDQEISHRFGTNGFTLFRLPVIKSGGITSFIGQNGIGKSTAMKILAGEIIPNFGKTDEVPTWDTVIEYSKGTEMQNYFQKLASKEIKTVRKPQSVDNIPKLVKGSVKDVLNKIDERNLSNELKDLLNMENFWDREVKHLSGGELQKVAIAAAVCREADIYLFDEPCSFLDVRERLNVGKVINELIKNRGTTEKEKTIVVIEHDLAILDYLSDYVIIFYGERGTYGIISQPHYVREGVNVFLDGYIPSENMRFRAESIVIKRDTARDAFEVGTTLFVYPSMKKKYKGFELEVKKGEIRKGEVIGILGPNGIGKTTFVKLLAGVEKPTEGMLERDENLKVSYKPQYLSAPKGLNVVSFLAKVGGEKVMSSYFQSSVLRPLGLDKLLDHELESLSGGELQKVAVAGTLSRDADLYLLDEPSAFLSIEDRLAVAKLVRRLVQERDAAAFVVEHDLIFQDYVADRLIVFEGTPSVKGMASAPMSMEEGMNQFLRNLKITFRRDPNTGRPRANKPGSRLEREQMTQGRYYYSLG